ncbi:MAG: hypothetical protein H6969_11540 [Gammaproteobacteria bacterium]|nr:hypothetical protein [Gammaproteobacteria bacterium]
MDDKTKTVVVLAAIAVFFVGYLVGGQRHGSAYTADSMASRSGADRHDHGLLEVPADLPIPTVSLIVHPDGMTGRNLEIVTEHFRFAPEHASAGDAPGEGHAHLYLDGEKIARVYGHWFHLDDPEPGAHQLQVTLNSNAHHTLARNGQPILAEQTLTIPKVSPN